MRGGCKAAEVARFAGKTRFWDAVNRKRDRDEARVQAGVSAARYAKLDAEQAAERAEAERAKVREQAATVWFWVGTTKDSQIMTSWQVVHVHNGSSMPVYDVTVWYRGAGTGFLANHAFSSVQPGERELSRNVEPGSVDVWFRDGANVYWRRSSDGTLSRWTGPGKPDDTEQWKLA